jgi:geranylgeranyl reductase family protein
MNVSHLKNDICIIGSGPAGMAAGIRLTQLNIPFTLIEREGFPRDKICGDGISGKSLMMLRKLGDRLPEAVGELENAAPSWGVRFFAPNQKSFSISFKDEVAGPPPGYVVPRSEFDQMLFDRLKNSTQVVIKERSPVSKIVKSHEGFEVYDPGGELLAHTRLLLLSTGYDKHLIQSLYPENPPLSNETIGLRVYYQGIGGLSEDNAIEFHFLKEILPGYLWIFPAGNGSANVGIGLARSVIVKKRLSLNKLLQELIVKYPYLHKRFKDARALGKPSAQLLPFFNERTPISGDNYLLLGDAARLVDPYTGEGIANAMLSGMIGAEVAADALKTGDYSSKQLKEYDQRVYSELEKELMLGLRLYELGKNSALVNLVIGRASRSKKIRNVLKDIVSGMNSMKELKNPIFYAKLLIGID